MLKASDPQNKMRSGSVDFVDTFRRGCDFLHLTFARNDVMGCLGNNCCMTGTARKNPSFRKMKLEIKL